MSDDIKSSKPTAVTETVVTKVAGQTVQETTTWTTGMSAMMRFIVHMGPAGVVCLVLVMLMWFMSSHITNLHESAREDMRAAQAEHHREVDALAKLFRDELRDQRAADRESREAFWRSQREVKEGLAMIYARLALMGVK